MKNKSALRLTEGAVMIALATVLSMIKLAEFPYGGSITAASLFPIALIAYRHGTAFGLSCGLLYGGIQQLLGLNNLSYFTTWQSVVAIILFDYILAFAVFGLSGVLRRTKMQANIKMTFGVVLACVLRYLCHVISGCTVWAGLSIPTSAALWYSIGYNATYMIPETLIVGIATWYLFSVLDFSDANLRRIPRKNEKKLPQNAVNCYRAALMLVVISVCYAIVRIFPLLQDENGNFDFAGITRLSLPSFAAVSGILLLTALILFAVGKAFQNKKVNK